MTPPYPSPPAPPAGPGPEAGSPTTHDPGAPHAEPRVLPALGRVLRVPEVAEILGMTAPQVQAAIRRGAITATRIGRCYLVASRSLEALFLGSRGGGPGRTSLAVRPHRPRRHR